MEMYETVEYIFLLLLNYFDWFHFAFLDCQHCFGSIMPIEITVAIWDVFMCCNYSSSLNHIVLHCHICSLFSPYRGRLPQYKPVPQFNPCYRRDASNALLSARREGTVMNCLSFWNFIFVIQSVYCTFWDVRFSW